MIEAGFLVMEVVWEGRAPRPIVGVLLGRMSDGLGQKENPGAMITPPKTTLKHLTYSDSKQLYYEALIDP
jgi:hypothetical protein